MKWLLKNYQTDFGWINFFSGIMISASINTVTGYCMSKDASEFSLLSFILTFISSAFFFALYKVLCDAKNDMESEIDNCESKLTQKDLRIRKKEVWHNCVLKYKLRINCFFIASVVTGILGIFVSLIICWYDTQYCGGNLLSTMVSKIFS